MRSPVRRPRAFLAKKLSRFYVVTVDPLSAIASVLSVVEVCSGSSEVLQSVCTASKERARLKSEVKHPEDIMERY